MKVLAMLIAELRHRPVSASAFLVVVSSATAWAMVSILLGRAAEQETRVIQRDIGLNVIILSEEADLDRYWVQGYSDAWIPSGYVDLLEDQAVANRLVPMIRRPVEWSGTTAMLVGIQEESFKGGQRRKPVFGKDLADNVLEVGGAVARTLGLEVGQEVELLGQEFTVGTVLSETGSEEDAWVHVDLDVARELLGVEGVVNEIRAIECHCSEDVEDPLAWLEAELEALLPGTQVIRRSSLADARREQRLQAERRLRATTPVLLVLASLVIGALGWNNARSRLSEVGVLRAFGYTGVSVSALFVGRALVLGLSGSLAGALAAYPLAQRVGEEIFRVSPGSVSFDGWLAFTCVMGAALLSVVSCLPPVALAVRSDPGEVLIDG